MQIALTLVPAAAPATGIDVAVDAAAGTPLGAVAAELRQAAGDCAGADLYAGPMRLAESTPLGSPGLRSGCRVGVGAPVDRGPSSPALVELSVVGGPDAGATHPLRRGRVIVGRDDTADVVVADPDLSRRHLALEIGSDAVRVADLGSTNCTRLDGCPLGAGLTDLPAGASLRAGESTLRIG
ncbi:MAG: FHA domain-containing protein, partial [Mycobacteriales bacterium]